MPHYLSSKKDKFEAIFHTWHRKVYQYAYNKSSSSYIAEETVQRVFIKLWDNLEHKKIDIDIEAQIFCISRTVLLDVIKQENRLKTIFTLETEVNAPSPTEILLFKEMYQKVLQIINNMSEMRRQIFKLSRFENLKHKEIAQLLHISPKTVENHIRLAIKTLRKSIISSIIVLLLFL